MSKTKKEMQWIEEAPKGDIRAGIIRSNLNQIFLDVIGEVYQMGLAREWGNAHPFTLKGVKDAIEHLHYYGFDDFRVLIPPFRKREALKLPEGTEKKEKIEELLNRGFTPIPIPSWLNPDSVGVPLSPAYWIPKDTVVVVPGDLDCIGEVVQVSKEHFAVIVHNPSRGMAIAR